MGWLEEVTDFLNVGMSGVDKLLTSKYAHENKIHAINTAADTLVATGELNALNADIKGKKTHLKQIRTQQEKDYNALRKKFEGMNAVITDWEGLSDEDITDSGFDWIKTEIKDNKDRMFQSINSMSATDLTMENMDRDVRANGRILANLEKLYDEETNVATILDAMGKEEGIAGMRDIDDSNAWLATLSGKVNEEGVELTNLESMSELNRLAYEAQLPDYLKQQKVEDAMNVPTNVMVDIDASRGKIDPVLVMMTDAEMSKVDLDKFRPERTWMGINREILKKQKVDEAILAGNRKQAIVNVNATSKSIKNIERTEGTATNPKYGDYKLTKEDLGGIPDNTLDIPVGADESIMLSDADTQMVNFYRLATKYLEDGSKTVDLKQFESWSPEQKYKIVSTLLSSDVDKIGKSLVGTNGRFKSDLWDFEPWKPNLLGGGGIDGDNTNFTRKYLNSLKEKIEYYGEYFETRGTWENLASDDPNKDKKIKQ